MKQDGDDDDDDVIVCGSSSSKSFSRANENLLMNFPSASHQHKANELLNFSFRRRCWTSLDLSLNCKFFPPPFVCVMQRWLKFIYLRKQHKKNLNETRIKYSSTKEFKSMRIEISSLTASPRLSHSEFHSLSNLKSTLAGNLVAVIAIIIISRSNY
jgi:hypothetical protein